MLSRTLALAIYVVSCIPRTYAVAIYVLSSYAPAICLATFDETTTHPPHFAEYFSAFVDVRTLGFSDAGGGLPENIKHIVDLYSTLDCCSSYDWHLLWHVAQSSFGMLRMTGFACARK